MKILIWPNLQLNTVSEPVTEPLDPEVLAAMERLMLDSGGIGLSAIQVGIPKTFFITKTHPKMPTKMYVNPTIDEFIGTRHPMLEGCLSLPGQFELVQRFPSVKISYYNPDLTMVKQETVDGIEAHCVQHENAHLSGELFVDKLPAARRSTIRGNLQQMKKRGLIK